MDDNLYIEFSAPLAMGQVCRLQNVCGLAAYHPARLDLVSAWSGLFDSAAEGRTAVLRYLSLRHTGRR